MIDVFKLFIARRGVDQGSKSLLDASVPKSQQDLLRRQTRIEVKGKSVNLITSQFGKSLNDDTLPKTPVWGNFKKWLQANDIKERYHFPVFYAVTKKPRNPHKGWIEKLKTSLIGFFKVGKGGNADDME